jgi:glycogen operon protein
LHTHTRTHAQDDEFDWEGDKPLETPMEDLVIYEMHVRGECALVYSETGLEPRAAVVLCVPPPPLVMGGVPAPQRI